MNTDMHCTVKYINELSRQTQTCINKYNFAKMLTFSLYKQDIQMREQGRGKG